MSNAEGPVDDSRVTGNRFARCGDDAVDLHGDRNVIDRHVVESTAEDGIEMDGADNDVSKNRITTPGGDGFEIGGTGNDLHKNAATGSSGLDL